MLKSNFLRLFLFSACATIASAATVTKTLQITATAMSSCSVTTTNIAFGNYNRSLLNTTGNVAVTCTSGTTYTIGLDGGANAGASNVTSRYMVQGTNQLPYFLYSDSARTVNWGNPTGGPTTAAGTGSAQNYPIYGRIPANQTAPASPNQYTDIVNVTVTTTP